MYLDGDYTIYLNNNWLTVLVPMVMLPMDAAEDGQVKPLTGSAHMVLRNKVIIPTLPEMVLVETIPEDSTVDLQLALLLMMVKLKQLLKENPFQFVLMLLTSVNMVVVFSTIVERVSTTLSSLPDMVITSGILKTHGAIGVKQVISD